MFTLILVLCLVGTVWSNDPIPSEEEVETFRSYVDITIRIQVDGLPASDLSELAYFLLEISEAIKDNTMFGPSVCVQLEDNYNSKWQLRVDIVKELTRSEASAIIAKIDQQREKSLEDRCPTEPHRPGAHWALVILERDENLKRVESCWIDDGPDRTSKLVSRIRKERETARIQIKHFTTTDFTAFVVVDSGKGTGDAIFDHYGDVHLPNRSKTVEGLRQNSNAIVNLLWERLQWMAERCNYTTRRVPQCYYMKDQSCVYDKSVVPVNSTKSLNMSPYFCNTKPARVPSGNCENHSECDMECAKQLDSMPCVPDCGEGTKTLSTTDVHTKYCTTKSTPCSNDQPCQTDQPKKSDQLGKSDQLNKFQMAGIGLMVVGLIFFFGSGLGLLVLYLLTAKKKKPKRYKAKMVKKTKARSKVEEMESVQAETTVEAPVKVTKGGSRKTKDDSSKPTSDKAKDGSRKPVSPGHGKTKHGSDKSGHGKTKHGSEKPASPGHGKAKRK